MSAHTPGPWRWLPNMTRLVSDDGAGVLSPWWDSETEEDGVAISDSDARRIVACVNACEGLNPEAIPGAVEVLRLCAASVCAGWPGQSRCTGELACGNCRARQALAALTGEEQSLTPAEEAREAQGRG